MINESKFKGFLNFCVNSYPNLFTKDIKKVIHEIIRKNDIQIDEIRIFFFKFQKKFYILK